MRDRYAYASLREGLVGAWIPSVSGSGLLLPDLSGNGNNGTLTNMGPEDWVAGEYGRALDFDGSNDNVNAKLGTIANTINENVFSVTLWALMRSFSNSPVLFTSKSAPQRDSLLIETNSTGSQLYVKCANDAIGLSGARTYTLSTQLVTGKWYAICFSKLGNGDLGRLLVNGKEQTVYSGTLSDSVVTSTFDFIFASYTTTGANVLNGQLDDIRIYNRALSESEIKLLSQEPGVGFKRTRSVFDFGRKPAYLPPTPTDYRTVRVKQTEHASLREGLVGAWCPSIEGSGYTLPDLSGQGNNGTLTNMGPEDWVAGEYGRALDFDGVDDYVVIGDVLDSVFVGTSAKFSIASWAHPASTEPGNVVAKIADSNFSENQRQFSVRYRLQALEFAWYGALDAASFKVIASTETIPLTTWTHVAVTFNASIANPDQKASLFINGNSAPYTLAFTAGTPVSIQNGTASLAIGASVNTGGTSSIGRFPGQLDDIRIYNRALSEPEIKLLASRPGIGLRPQRRTMYYAPPTGARRRRILTSMP